MSVSPERRRAQAATRRRRLRRRRLLIAGTLLATGAGIAVAAVAWHSSHRPKPVLAVPPVRAVRSRRPYRRHVTAGPRPDRASRNADVPILMYHVLAAPFPNAPYPGLYVPAPEFAAQMRALAGAGYHAVTLRQVRDAWLGRAGLPRHPIVISFDNGYRTQYTVGLRVLRRLHWRGVENLQLSGLPPRQGGLTRTEVERMLAAGWELDTQGYSHADLPALDPRSLDEQVDLGVRLIERDYGVRPRWFCYPSGRYDPAVIDAVRRAGFVGATTVVPGWANRTDDLFRLPRLRVLGGTSPRALLALIRETRSDSRPPPTY